MMSGRSALGLIAGVLLGLGVVALAGSGLNPYVMKPAPARSMSNQTGDTYTVYVTTTNANGAKVVVPKNESVPLYLAAINVPSQVDSIAKQPVTLTGFVLLPIFAALLFGFAIFRVSKMRSEEEEPPEAV